MSILDQIREDLSEIYREYIEEHGKRQELFKGLTNRLLVSHPRLFDDCMGIMDKIKSKVYKAVNEYELEQGYKKKPIKDRPPLLRVHPIERANLRVNNLTVGMTLDTFIQEKKEIHIPKEFHEHWKNSMKLLQFKSATLRHEITGYPVVVTLQKSRYLYEVLEWLVTHNVPYVKLYLYEEDHLEKHKKVARYIAYIIEKEDLKTYYEGDPKIRSKLREWLPEVEFPEG